MQRDLKKRINIIFTIVTLLFVVIYDILFILGYMQNDYSSLLLCVVNFLGGVKLLHCLVVNIGA